jgi:hypothetical protein
MGLIGLKPKGGSTAAMEVEAVCDRLSAAGYRLRPHPDLGGFAAKRAEYAESIKAISDHLGTPMAPLVPLIGG